MYAMHYSSLLPPANCSDPNPLENGSIEAFQNTTEGAEIFFECDPGFAPAGKMRAVCTSDGRWNPDPAMHMCTCKYPMWPTKDTSYVQFTCYENA